MLSFRKRLERMTGHTWQELDDSRDPRDRINNCQILHYSRRNPNTGEVGDHLDWLISICPSKPEWSWDEWQRIERVRYSNEELLAEVERTPRLYDGSY